MMAGLGFKKDSKCLKYKRMDGTRQWCYIMPYDELYALFNKKGWIHSRDREDYGIDNESEESPTPISKPESASQPKPEKNTHPIPDSPKPVSKKVPPPIPPKPDHLKVSTNSSNTDNKQKPLGIPGPSGTSIESQSIETKTEVKSLESKSEEEMPPTQSNPSIVQQSIKFKKKPDALIKLENKENRTKSEEKKYQALHLDWIISGVDNLESS